jgi:hypothetical protein
MERPIRSDFYSRKELVKKTASKWACTAVPNAISHLQWGDYDATHVEVHDLRDGKLLAVVRARLNGAQKRILEVLYEHQGVKEINSEKEQS